MEGTSRIRFSTRVPLPLIPVLSLQEQKQLAYFIRKENADISEENFHEVVQFGTVRRPYIDSLMRMLNAIYLPRLFHRPGWPESIKNEFFLEIYHFMTSLTGRALPAFALAWQRPLLYASLA